MTGFYNKALFTKNLTDIMKNHTNVQQKTINQLSVDIVAENEELNIFRAKAIRAAGYAKMDTITPADLGSSKDVQREMKGEGILTLWRHPLKPNSILMFIKTGDVYQYGGVITPD